MLTVEGLTDPTTALWLRIPSLADGAAVWM